MSLHNQARDRRIIDFVALSFQSRLELLNGRDAPYDRRVVRRVAASWHVRARDEAATRAHSAIAHGAQVERQEATQV